MVVQLSDFGFDIPDRVHDFDGVRAVCGRIEEPRADIADPTLKGVRLGYRFGATAPERLLDSRRFFLFVV